MQMKCDTIAAIATAAGAGAISIVRVSGPDSLRIADQILRCSGAPPSQRAGNTFVHGIVESRAGDGVARRHVDEVIMLVYRAPHSYTREDVVEFQGHGGRESARRILNMVLDAGARLAEPGEFTKRAFLSGRIDLLQAEAIMDLIGAQSERAASAAMEQLEGRLSCFCGRIYDDTVMSAADLEALLDFPDEEFPAGLLDQASVRLKTVAEHITEILGTWSEGRILREGALVVISGKTNVGKSTLMNCMLGMDRAIVSPTPGTTRDFIEETLVLGGIPVRLVDTAGMRDTDCTIEREGMRRARAYTDRADLRLHMLDASQPLDAHDREMLAELDPLKAILILNKTDAGHALSQNDFPGCTCVECSLIMGKGLEVLRNGILDKMRVGNDPAPRAVISERHRQLMQRGLDGVLVAAELLSRHHEAGMVEAVESLRGSMEALGELTGRVHYDDLLTSVFSRFCIGK